MIKRAYFFNPTPYHLIKNCFSNITEMNLNSNSFFSNSNSQFLVEQGCSSNRRDNKEKLVLGLFGTTVALNHASDKDYYYQNYRDFIYVLQLNPGLYNLVEIIRINKQVKHVLSNALNDPNQSDPTETIKECLQMTEPFFLKAEERGDSRSIEAFGEYYHIEAHSILHKLELRLKQLEKASLKGFCDTEKEHRTVKTIEKYSEFESELSDALSDRNVAAYRKALETQSAHLRK